MLNSLSIRNIALIKELHIEFDRGFNVLSGETGAGKSIIVDSINFVLGAKADKTLIRHGEQQARVECVFLLSPEQRSRIEAFDLGVLEDGEDTLILCRTLSESGKNECRINGKAVTAASLKQVSGELVDIHGQHEHQSLLNPVNHMRILDGYINPSEYKTVSAKVAAAYNLINSIENERKALGGSEADRIRTMDLLKYQLDEIEKAKISTQEEDELIAKRQKLAHMEKILTSVKHCHDLLCDSEGVCERLSSAMSALTPASRYDNESGLLLERLNSASLELTDISDMLSAILGSNDFDEKSAEENERRLETYASLKRKYGGSVDGVLSFRDRIALEYDNLVNSEQRLNELSKALDKAKKEYYESASVLSRLRKDASSRLETALISELSDLGMSNCAFAVVFKDTERDGDITSKGIDKLEFYLSANKGEPVKPLTKIISGGEMSRLMLALKVISIQTDNIETMVFDEIDTGISGKVGQAVAEKLAKIARSGQIFCVTHLAQIAAMADSQYLIKKGETDGKTTTSVYPLDYDQMIDEISRLSGGKDISKAAESQARQMKEWSDTFKRYLH